MGGVGLRLGSKRRHLAALSNHLQVVRSNHVQGCLCLGIWQLCLTCSCIPRAMRAPRGCGEGCRAAASLSWCYRRSTKRKGVGKRTPQSRAANQTIALEKKKRRQHFQSPKHNISMEIAGRGLLSISDQVGLTRFCLFFPTSSIISGSSEDRLLCLTNARVLVSDFWLSAKQSLEGWHLSFICGFLLAKVHFSLWHLLIMPCPLNATSVTLCSWLWLCMRPWTVQWCCTSQWPVKLLWGTVGHEWNWHLGSLHLLWHFFSEGNPEYL